MNEVYITHAKRTAIGSFLGSLSDISAPFLGAEVIRNIISDSKIDPNALDEVILGQVITGGSGQNPARQTVIHSKLPEKLVATTINKVCGSGLKAVCLAANAIKAGEANMILAGGQENMSLGLHGGYLRGGTKFGDIKLIDFMMNDGLTDAFSNKLMGITAENVAAKFNISRLDQDNYALDSQLKSTRAQEQNIFKDEIIPVSVQRKKEAFIFDKDEGVRANSTAEGLARLKPAFKEDGTVTAGNSSQINDGAACMLVASGEALKKYNLTPIVRIVSYASYGVDPSIMGTGPVPASKLALEKAGWKVGDLDLIEANEAFAAQSVYVNKEMGWDVSKVNVSGGAIALGHPIGASGARVLITLLHGMKRLRAKKGLVTLCIGGGMGIAMCIELC